MTALRVLLHMVDESRAHNNPIGDFRHRRGLIAGFYAEADTNRKAGYPLRHLDLGDDRGWIGGPRPRDSRHGNEI